MSRLKKHVRNYTQVANDIINDKRLSLKAKGLYLFLVSKPENWEFSARLIATQNNDQKASINSALHELEDFGLLRRVHVQGGYDYEIYDKIKVHVAENRLNRKSAKQLPKIDLTDFRLNISNKDYIAKKKEEEENFSIPFLPQFLQWMVIRNPRVKNPAAYAETLFHALKNDNDKRHLQTQAFYDSFIIQNGASVVDSAFVSNPFSYYENMER